MMGRLKNSSNKSFKPIGTITLLLIYTAILAGVWLAIYFLMVTRGGFG